MVCQGIVYELKASHSLRCVALLHNNVGVLNLYSYTSHFKGTHQVLIYLSSNLILVISLHPLYSCSKHIEMLIV